MIILPLVLLHYSVKRHFGGFFRGWGRTVCTNPDFMHFLGKQHPDFMYFSANRHTDFMHFSTKQHPDFMHEGLTKAGNSGILSIVQESGVLGYVETKNV